MTFVEKAVIAVIILIVVGIALFPGSSGPEDGQIGYYTTEWRYNPYTKMSESYRVWHPVVVPGGTTK